MSFVFAIYLKHLLLTMFTGHPPLAKRIATGRWVQVPLCELDGFADMLTSLLWTSELMFDDSHWLTLPSFSWLSGTCYSAAVCCSFRQLNPSVSLHMICCRLTSLALNNRSWFALRNKLFTQYARHLIFIAYLSLNCSDTIQTGPGNLKLHGAGISCDWHMLARGQVLVTHGHLTVRFN